MRKNPGTVLLPGGKGGRVREEGGEGKCEGQRKERGRMEGGWRQRQNEKTEREREEGKAGDINKHSQVYHYYHSLRLEC